MTFLPADDLKREMDEMALLLLEIQGGARELFDPSEEKRILQSKRLSNDQKRGKSTSSWAKSTVSREMRPLYIKGFTADGDLMTDISKSEKVVKSRATAHSFGRRYPAVSKVEIENCFYDINVDSTSTKKRVLSTKFSKASRGETLSNQKNDDVTSDKLHVDKVDLAINGDTSNDCSSDVDRVANHDRVFDTNECKSLKRNRVEKDNYQQPICGSHHEHTPIAYSFPKSSREIRIVQESTTDGENLDVETAEKKLHPHIMGACMRPQSVARRTPPVQNESELNPQKGNVRHDVNETLDIMAHMDVLSSKVRAPTYTMHQNTKKERRNIDISKMEKGTPGPGEYCPNGPPQSGEG